MEYVHHCGFCDWHRQSRSATILSPRCESCGCSLASSPRSEYLLGRQPQERLRAPSGMSLMLGKAAAAVAAALLVAATTTFGYHEGGPALAIAAVGVGGLLSLPLLVPGR
jgi:hypothetical protein